MASSPLKPNHNLNHSHSLKTLIVAIDGPAGAGKSSVAKKLAKILNISYLDTGAMYRALAFKALENKINLEDEDQLVKLAKQTTIDLNDTPQGLKVLLDGKDVSDDIRTLEVTNNTFYVARAPKVREIMVEWQRRIAGEKSVVAEGRDIGTVVFPKATYKFYMDADIKERANRRYRELMEKGKTVDAQKLLEEVKERDEKDFSRSTGPLCRAEDAIYLETTHQSVDEVVEDVLKYIKK
jgi:cytidylate kinase